MEIERVYLPTRKDKKNRYSIIMNEISLNHPETEIIYLDENSLNKETILRLLSKSFTGFYELLNKNLQFELNGQFKELSVSQLINLIQKNNKMLSYPLIEGKTTVFTGLPSDILNRMRSKNVRQIRREMNII